MYDTNMNALTELAEHLGEITSAWRPAEPTGQYAIQSISYVRKASRIIAELAKVPFVYNVYGNHCEQIAMVYDSAIAVERCRRIAEEGVEE